MAVSTTLTDLPRDPRGERGPKGPSFFPRECEAEIVRITNTHFYLYGQVEIRPREGQGHVAWTEKIVARGFARESLRVVKSLEVGDKVFATFYFYHKGVEWLVSNVRHLHGPRVPAKGAWPCVPHTFRPLQNYRADLKATFAKIPAQVLLSPDLAVKLLGCGAVIRLRPRTNYYEGGREITFLRAKSCLMARAKDTTPTVEVDAELYGSDWTVRKVYLPASAHRQLPRTVEDLPVLVPKAEETELLPPLVTSVGIAETPDADIAEDCLVFGEGRPSLLFPGFSGDESKRAHPDVSSTSLLSSQGPSQNCGSVPDSEVDGEPPVDSKVDCKSPAGSKVDCKSPAGSKVDDEPPADSKVDGETLADPKADGESPVDSKADSESPVKGKLDSEPSAGDKVYSDVMEKEANSTTGNREASPASVDGRNVIICKLDGTLILKH